MKARYYRYTDATFSTKWASDPRWEHLGILGRLLFLFPFPLLLDLFLNSKRSYYLLRSWRYRYHYLKKQSYDE